MSYRCKSCDEVQPTGTAPTKVVTAIRTYDGTVAWQIAKEVDACPPCAEKLKEKGPVDNRASVEGVYSPYKPLPEFENNVPDPR
jgi:hypothetical protein